MAKPGRNDPCPCGSGKKYKKCCLNKNVPTSLTHQKMRRTEGKLIPQLVQYAIERYGEEVIEDAWDEFTGWTERPMDPETMPELDAFFMPWFAFNWMPEESEESEQDNDEFLQDMPMAQHYLQDKTVLLDSFERRFIEEVSSQPYSFFQITDTTPGKSLSLRDILLQREVTVHERQASTQLRKGDILFTRTMTLDDTSIMVGCAPTVIPADYISGFINLREKLTDGNPDFGRSFLFEFDIDLLPIYFDLMDKIHNPTPPQLYNTDHQRLQPTTQYYQLLCSADEALQALASLSLSNADELLDSAELDDDGRLQTIRFPWLIKGNQQYGSWENTVMGDLCIDGDRLTIKVNSQERADAIRRKITHRLGKRAPFQRALIESIEQTLKAKQAAPQAGRGVAEPEIPNTPQIQAMLKEAAMRHWQDWLDIALPALQGQTPREAAKSASTHERLEALLLQFEGKDDDSNPFAPDVAALRREIGLD
jgi:hypothetical protein